MLHSWTAQALQRKVRTTDTIQTLLVLMDISWLDRLVIFVVLLAALYWTAKRYVPLACLMTHAVHHACVNPCLDALCTVWAALRLWGYVQVFGFSCRSAGSHWGPAHTCEHCWLVHRSRTGHAAEAGARGPSPVTHIVLAPGTRHGRVLL